MIKIIKRLPNEHRPQCNNFYLFFEYINVGVPELTESNDRLSTT